MTDVKEIKNDVLEKVAGGIGDAPNDIKPKFNIDDIVRDNRGWVFKVVEITGFERNEYTYKLQILEINSFSMYSKVGDDYYLSESNLTK